MQNADVTPEAGIGITVTRKCHGCGKALAPLDPYYLIGSKRLCGDCYLKAYSPREMWQEPKDG